MSSSIPGMYPYQRLVMSGEYSHWFLNESPEVKETMYEILLEYVIKLGEIHFDASGNINTDKLLEYLKNEFHYTGEYTELNRKTKESLEELRKLKEKEIDSVTTILKERGYKGPMAWTTNKETQTKKLLKRLIRLKQLKESDRIQLILEVIKEFVEPNINAHQLKNVKNAVYDKYGITVEPNDDISGPSDN